MNNKPIAAVLIAVSTFLSVPAFASGYGPAPFYRPSVGAPASQRGQSEQTVTAERQNAGNESAESSYGGAVSFSSGSGDQRAVAGPHGIFSRH